MKHLLRTKRSMRKEELKNHLLTAYAEDAAMIAKIKIAKKHSGENDLPDYESLTVLYTRLEMEREGSSGPESGSKS